MRFFRRGIPNVERMRERGDIEGLVRALSHEDDGVRGRAALELRLAAYGGEFVSRDQVAELMIGQLSSPVFYLRREAVELLDGLGGTTAHELLIGELKGPARVAAAKALGGTGDARAVEPLIGMLSDPWVTFEAAKSLGELGDARAVEPLIGLLKGHRGYSTTTAAVEALGRLGDARAVQPLLDVLDRDWSTDEPGLSVKPWRDAVTQALGRILGKLGASAADMVGEKALAKLIVHPEAEICSAAAAVLDEMATQGDARALKLLTVALTKGSPQTREQAAAALAKLGDARAVEPLVKAASSGDFRLCESAIRALVALHDEGALERVVRAFAARFGLSGLARLDVPGAAEQILRTREEIERQHAEEQAAIERRHAEEQAAQERKAQAERERAEEREAREPSMRPLAVKLAGLLGDPGWMVDGWTIKPGPRADDYREALKTCRRLGLPVHDHQQGTSRDASHLWADVEFEGETFLVEGGEVLDFGNEW